MKNSCTKIVLCGEVFSPNLGDQAIAVCMKHLISSAAPGSSIELLDLSGRFAADNGTSRVAGRHHSILRSLRKRGAFVRRILNAIVWWGRARRKFVTAARTALRDADLLVVGGGQLLADNDWVFPLRLAALSREAERASVSMVVFGCGVGVPRSRFGTYLIRAFLSRAQRVVVRDSDSIERLSLFGVTQGAVSLTIDPAIMCGALFQPPRVNPTEVVGVGIISPDVLARHSRLRQRESSWWLAFWTELARQLRAGGINCEFFTNGDNEDLVFARSVQESAAAAGVEMKVRHPASLGELVQMISAYRAIIGHRLHASIIAFSTGTPSVGLQWDSKIDAFYKRIERERLCVDASRDSVNDIAAIVVEVAMTRSANTRLSDLSKELSISIQRVIRAALPDHVESNVSSMLA